RGIAQRYPPRTRPAANGPPVHPERSRNHLSESNSEGPDGPLRRLRRPGRRLAAVAGWRANHGAAPPVRPTGGAVPSQRAEVGGESGGGGGGFAVGPGGRCH